MVSLFKHLGVMHAANQSTPPIFSDQLPADTWMELLDLDPLTPKARRRRILDRIMDRNFHVHSREVGAAILATSYHNLYERARVPRLSPTQAPGCAAVQVLKTLQWSVFRATIKLGPLIAGRG